MEADEKAEQDLTNREIESILYQKGAKYRGEFLQYFGLS
jgi:hypothetical protein